MIICDCHCDTLYNLAIGKKKGNDISLARLQKAGVSLQVMAMYIGSNPQKDIVRRRMQDMLSAFEEWKQNGAVQAFSACEATEDQSKMLLSIEGGEAYEDGLSILDDFVEKGVRMASLTWNFDNSLACCHLGDKAAKLSNKGLLFVKHMQDKKVAVDVSHLNEGGFYDIFARSHHVPMASHSCARSLCDHSRNLSDAQLKLLFANGGFVGVNFYPAFLSKSGKCSTRTVAEHIHHMYELGGQGMVGFGSDFDGIETKPEGLDNPLDYGNLIAALYAFGFSRQDVEDIAGCAFIRYFDKL